MQRSTNLVAEIAHDASADAAHPKAGDLACEVGTDPDAEEYAHHLLARRKAIFAAVTTLPAVLDFPVAVDRQQVAEAGAGSPPPNVAIAAVEDGTDES